jgi:nitrite reductase (NADH) small subunit
MIPKETAWIRVTPCSSIPVREGRCVEISSRQVAIFHTSEGFLAVENRCPHRSGPLADGIVSGTAVVCPLHAWKFDLCSGASINHPESSAALITYPTRIEDGIICVELPTRAASGDSVTPPCEYRDRPIRWVQRKASPPMCSADAVGGTSSLHPNPPRAQSPQDHSHAPNEL